MLYLSEKDVAQIIENDYKWVVDIMREMFQTIGNQDYSLGGKRKASHGLRMEYDKNSRHHLFIAMPGYLGDPFNVTGMKWHGPMNKWSGRLSDSNYMIYLNDCDSGQLRACISANLLTEYRTAAVSILAALCFASRNIKSIAIIGPGKINTLIVKGLLSLFSGIEKIFVKGRGNVSIERFVSSIQQENSGIEITVVDTIQQAIKDADVVSINTGFQFDELSDAPLVRDQWIKPKSVFLCSSFAFFSDNLICRRAINACDFFSMYESYEEELGSPVYKKLSWLGNRFVDLIREKRITRNSIIEMSDVILGKKQIDSTSMAPILFSSGGFALEDIAVAQRIYEKALEKNLGINLEIG